MAPTSPTGGWRSSRCWRRQAEVKEVVARLVCKASFEPFISANWTTRRRLRVPRFWGQVLGTGSGSLGAFSGTVKATERKGGQTGLAAGNPGGERTLRAAAHTPILHGKEGVNGSSSLEGLSGTTKLLQTADFPLLWRTLRATSLERRAFKMGTAAWQRRTGSIREILGVQDLNWRITGSWGQVLGTFEAMEVEVE